MFSLTFQDFKYNNNCRTTVNWQLATVLDIATCLVKCNCSLHASHIVTTFIGIPAENYFPKIFRCILDYQKFNKCGGGGDGVKINRAVRNTKFLFKFEQGGCADNK